MRWRDMRGSENVEDREGHVPRGMGGLGGGMKIGGLGLIVVLVVSVLLGQNPLEILNMLQGPVQEAPLQPAPQRPGGGTPATDENKEFVARVLGDTEDTWTEVFKQMGQQYRPPRLVLFGEAVESACGMASSAVGPFYCSADSRVYLDLSFFQDLKQRFGAPGEFARAYVIAHEIGHHVQNQLGITEKVAQQRERASESTGNALSVRMELQADCLAGVWGAHAHDRGLLDQADLESGMNAAAAIGDDRIQRQARGYVRPESFTHGSSAQRVRWFRAGLESGEVRQCNTFSTDRL